jgi:hypothetical protein
MAFRFVLFLVFHFFLRMSHCISALAFDFFASLRARPIASIASYPSLHKIFHLCLPLEAAPPHDIVDGH